MRNATDRGRRPTGLRRFFSPLAIVVILALAVATLLTGLGIRNYVNANPAFCKQCHVTQRQYQLWERSEHKDVACQECHQVSEPQAMDLLYQTVFDPPASSDEPLHSPPVPVDACTGCHSRGNQQWPQITGTHGHDVHLGHEEVSCKSCHARSIHRFQAAQSACVECHDTRVFRGKCMEDVRCISCHNFLSHEDTLRPSRSTCNECHDSHGVAGMERETDHGHSAMECWKCHVPHQDIGQVVQVACTTCHDDLPQIVEHEDCEDHDCFRCHTVHRIDSGEER